MDNELYHYGRKGMKWYQNIFTKNKRKGGKRDRTDNADESPNKSKTNSQSDSYKSSRKPLSEMEKDELDAAVNRLRSEQAYKQLYSELHPEQISRGKQFVRDAWDKAISPAIIESGKKITEKFLTKTMSNLLGLDEKDANSAYEMLKKEADIASKKKTIYDSEKARIELENKIREQSDAKKTAEESSKPKPDNTSKKDQTEDTSKEKTKDTSKEKTKDTSKGKTKDTSTNKKDADNVEKVSGTVEGTGTSTRQSTFNQQSSKPNKDIIDVEIIRETTVSDLRHSPAYAIGQRYIQNLLEDKNK